MSNRINNKHMIDIYISVLAIIFSSIAPIPQIYLIYVRKSADDISYASILFNILLCVTWLLYGLYISSIPLITADSIVTIEYSLIGIQKYYYSIQNIDNN